MTRSENTSKQLAAKTPRSTLHAPASPARYSSSSFSYNPKTSVMSADAGDLGWNGETEIIIRSARTGTEVTFKYAAQDSTGDGEVQGWEFWPEAIVGINVYIFND